jgi:hypothetical protein
MFPDPLKTWFMWGIASHGDDSSQAPACVSQACHEGGAVVALIMGIVVLVGVIVFGFCWLRWEWQNRHTRKERREQQRRFD